jgi:1-acyl-sn-glycerol-3-phosphate acyltransferase
MPKEVKRLKSPYLVVGNHVGFFDPFITGNFLPKYIHYVASDFAFRNPIFRFFLTRLGTIPKKKNMTDGQVIRDIIRVIRQGENVGIFPEAVRNWAGKSFYIDPSIIKLIKVLKVDVVSTTIKGMNLFNPRWAQKPRRTRVEIDYRLLFSADEVQSLSAAELYDRLVKTLFHDEVEYQRQHLNPIRSKYRAEYISHALYVCPDCLQIDTFHCEGNDFHCSNCAYDLHINTYGFFERKDGGKLYFDNIRDWYYWQEKYLTDLINDILSSGQEGIIFHDKQAEVLHQDSGPNFISLGLADVSLYPDMIKIEFTNKDDDLLMNFNDLQAINPQVKEQLEIYYKGVAYRIIGPRKGTSALKWEVAVNAIWRRMGHKHKLSPYINPD